MSNLVLGSILILILFKNSALISVKKKRFFKVKHLTSFFFEKKGKRLELLSSNKRSPGDKVIFLTNH